MSWYNNIKIMEDNVGSFFRNYKHIDYNLLNICLQIYFKAEQEKNKSSEAASKPDSSIKQRIRHETNCQDFEQKRMILAKCIELLNITQ
jgi:hypothetical protein